MTIMSLNTVREDMVQVSHSRDLRAKRAGQALYQGGHLQPDTLPNQNVRNVEAGNNENVGKMSAVRRTFCLFVAFDLILSFILWVIYTQLIGDTGWSAFRKQVGGYNFKYSLFDTVLVAAVRLTFLLLAYALYRIRHWWTVALTTCITCMFLITKIFLFEFDTADSSKNPLSYVLLIISFVLAWVETWFLDFKVLPVEKKEWQRRRVHGYANERTPLLRDSGQSGDENQYYSPIDTPEGSDDEAERPRDRFYSVPGSRGHTRQASQASIGSMGKEQDYLKIASEAWETLWNLISKSDSDWKLEVGSDPSSGCVHSTHVPKSGKVFRLQAIIGINPKDLFEDLIHRIDESPRWNPTVIECRTLQVLDDQTDIQYNVAAEAGGGLISSRDFVSVRRFGVKDDSYMSAGCAITHAEMPPQKKYVRGENGVGGWVFKPVAGEPDQCLFIWVVNTNLKGWLPQKLIDQTLSGVLLDYVKLLRQHAKDIETTPYESV